MGMLRVVFNKEVGNYYSKSTFIVTLIKQETLVLVIYFKIYLRIYVFLQNYLRVPRYPKIANFGYPVPENAQP